MSDTRVIIAQLGARKHYQEPLLLNKWGILETLYTDFYAGNIPMLSLFKQPSVFNKLPNIVKKAIDRYEPSLNNSKIIHFPWFGYQYAQKLKQAQGEDLSSIFVWANKEFSRKILQRGLGKANVIYGFNGASLELFQYAKQKGMRCILDQTLAERSLVHQLLLEEENIWQGWSNSPFTVSDADLNLVQREQQEQDLADHIICGSQFVKDSLIARGVDVNKITVVSLGRIKESQSLQKFSQRSTPKERGDGLRILFAGEVGLRKGIPYLLEALKQLHGKIPFTCKAAGGISIQPELMTEYSDVCHFMGRVPRSHMAELYAWADVFVLPSICEGSAMVTYEALSWGLPVVTTHNAGSVIRNGIDGYILPIRCANSIANTLINIFHSFIIKFDSNRFEHLHHLYKDNEKRLKSVIENKC
ncbi:glycosyltransferase family 4 protein [Nostocales cyanobacterium LEGE 11386]|nr:glycosyltransferase family 4 protein [Nostocales cyanobacterium LEGE 11386]